MTKKERDIIDAKFANLLHKLNTSDRMLLLWDNLKKMLEKNSPYMKRVLKDIAEIIK